MGKIVTFWRYIKFGLNTETGFFDKAVLEAMSSGLSVIVSGLAFKNIIPDKRARPNFALREIVVKNHSLQNTVAAISARLREGV